MTDQTPKWTPPNRDPAFVHWLYDLLNSNYGCPLEPYEIVGQLEQATGFTEEELVAVLGVPEDFFAEPDGEGDGEDD